jgi:luciferase family oxidoreductase group 1
VKSIRARPFGESDSAGMTLPPLSVLDLFPISTGSRPTEAIRDSVALAKRVDDLGYARYWIAEHHNMPNIASSAPEILIGHVASQTKRVRVGAGGIMLPNHAPLHVLEVFRTLNALYPDRIDLGVGRAPGTDQVTSAALKRQSSFGGEVNEQIAELYAFATKSFPANHPFAKIDVMPVDAPMPQLWMLGSTSAGATIAAELGLPFAFAGHFSMADSDGAVARYRNHFSPSDQQAESRLMMAVSIVCAETDERARELALPLRVAFARLATGNPGAFPSIEEAKNHVFTPQELAIVERFGNGAIIGSEKTVRAGLEALIERTHPDEIMVSTVIPIQTERVASYERVAKLWGM